MDTAILGLLRNDSLKGVGMLVDCRERDRKDKETGNVIEKQYYVDVSKMGANLSIRMAKTEYQRMCAELSDGKLNRNQSIIEYDCEIQVEADSFTWGEGKSMATSKFSEPTLKSFKRVG